MASFSPPNPMRAHGAWIYLFASVGAGAIAGADRGIERMLLVGTGFIGAFHVFSAFAIGTTRNRRQILVGCGWAAFTFLTALAFGAHVDFLAVAAFSVVPAALAIVLAKQVGYLSRSTLASGLAALSLAAPTVALAGGVSVGRSSLLFLLLWPFFCWRTWRIAAPLRETSAWNRAKLKQQGLREAAYVALWSLAAAIFVRTVDGSLLPAVIGPIFPSTSYLMIPIALTRQRRTDATGQGARTHRVWRHPRRLDRGLLPAGVCGFRQPNRIQAQFPSRLGICTRIS